MVHHTPTVIPVHPAPKAPEPLIAALSVLAVCSSILIALVWAFAPEPTRTRCISIAAPLTLALLAALYAARRLKRPAALPGSVSPTTLHMLPLESVPAVVREAMDVRLALARPHAAIFRGPLQTNPAAAYESVARAFPEHTVMLEADPEVGARLAVISLHEARPRPARPFLAAALFGLTLVTTTLAGALYAGFDPEAAPRAVWHGVPYALGLLAILGVHELGHYIAARRHSMNVSLPYFIPAPFALGTFGAFIRLRSPARDRIALFDMAVAGPLAGLIAALPILWFGLRHSDVSSAHLLSPDLGTPGVNSSLLFGLIARLAIAAPLPPDAVVELSPLGFAGWLGLFVTGLNLIPIGELDGGHIVHAMFGRAAGEAISSLGLALLFALAVFVAPGLLVWALLVFIIAGRTAPPRNDLTPLTPGRRALGWFALLVFASIVLPFPSTPTAP